MDTTDCFNRGFEALTGSPPFPWQRALFLRFLENRSDNIPASCNLPTGLGKTSVVAVWLLALAHCPAKMPRRLVYVVNRRTVVDQTTDEAEKLRRRLTTPEKEVQNPELIAVLRSLAASLSKPGALASDLPIAISTLRGQFADNREWSADPSRPAIIIGTVDMIGSRLLFSGYGVGFKAKPLHAGFLGQDVLLVHDEAHLEPAFQRLLTAIEQEQKRCKEFGRFRVMELTATSRGNGDVFGLTPDEKAGKVPVVRDRLFAKKGIKLIPSERANVSTAIGKMARDRWNASDKAILIFVRTVDDVNTVHDELIKKRKDGPEELRAGVPVDRIQVLTGTLRGLERDRMANPRRPEGCPVFARFLPKPNPTAPESEQWKVTPREGAVYLICTSAGEVGVDISADHMVSDLTPLDSMAQRFGRVNRRGGGAAEIDVVYESDPDPKKQDDPFEQARWATFSLLDGLPECDWIADRYEASPHEIGGLIGRLTNEQRMAAFSPHPTFVDTSDILFDAWALTTIRDKLPGRPPVEPYLHGLSDYDPPQTAVAWREEVELLTEKVLALNNLKPADLLELYPLKPHEQLSGPTRGKNKVFEQLEKIAARDAAQPRDPPLSAWVIAPDGTVAILPLEKLVAKDRQNNPIISLGNSTVLLPPSAGGLKSGLLDGAAPFEPGAPYDVSDQWFGDGDKRRFRLRVSEESERDDEKKPAGMRLIQRIMFPSTESEEDLGWSWQWFIRPRSADDDASKTSIEPIRWQHHTNDVVKEARRLADVLLKDLPDLRTALVLAARWHDLGKKRAVWQRSIGHRLPKSPKPEDWLAKSGGKMRPLELTDYRHEYGSLIEATKLVAVAELEEFGQQPESVRELILHLIATHHGFARPHFPLDQAFDPDHGETSDIAAAVPRRFAKLQRKYGRWGLAYLESLLRAADWAASAKPSPNGENQS
ncbi:MAG: type I-U CRISPR-associated helicase/endonuclease Cas3 [Planctomycetaceae bacterium]|nr:type I-U CRISPR-associated helicase/endonuclease Cas3 [Planctomycetaceae bacterium]